MNGNVTGILREYKLQKYVKIDSHLHSVGLDNLGVCARVETQVRGWSDFSGTEIPVLKSFDREFKPRVPNLRF